MKIPWKLKSFIFGWIDLLNAPRILYFLQKHVTKRSSVGILRISTIWEDHKEFLTKYGATSFIFEFGAGKTLAQNLFLSDIVGKQLVVDLNDMMDFKLVDNVREQTHQSLALQSEVKIDSLKALSQYGIDYRAPYDAAQTDLQDKSIDACISTNTLEHIPKEDIISIFYELHRILKDNGIVSAKIDYTDHYAHTDKTISLLNYLKFDEHVWKRYNHACHYQNRLRHYEYVEIFRKCGYVVQEEELVYAESSIPTELFEVFRGKDETWKATAAHIILKKAD